MKFVMTNDEYLPSDCYKCDRSDGRYCWLNKKKPEPVAICRKFRDRCGYYIPVEDGGSR